MICPLTPQLLGKWVDSPPASPPRLTTRDYFSTFQLSREAYVRLIAALDKSIPCWLETSHKPQRIDGSVGQFDLALARVVREARGHISVVEAYRRLSHPTERNCCKLTVENFLRMLRSVERTVIEFKNPHSPIIRLCPSNAGVFLRDVPTQNGKSSTARKVHSNLSAIQFFSTKNGFCERRAVARR
jgi:hypothetical protein